MEGGGGLSDPHDAPPCKGAGISGRIHYGHGGGSFSERGQLRRPVRNRGGKKALLRRHDAGKGKTLPHVCRAEEDLRQIPLERALALHRGIRRVRKYKLTTN